TFHLPTSCHDTKHSNEFSPRMSIAMRPSHGRSCLCSGRGYHALIAWSALSPLILQRSPKTRTSRPVGSVPGGDLSRCSKSLQLCNYAITSSAIASTPDGIVSCSVLAVFRLIRSADLEQIPFEFSHSPRA